MGQPIDCEWHDDVSQLHRVVPAFASVHKKAQLNRLRPRAHVREPPGSRDFGELRFEAKRPRIVAQRVFQPAATLVREAVRANQLVPTQLAPPNLSVAVEAALQMEVLRYERKRLRAKVAHFRP